jgi:uncharacterized delta-60 repeat protein/uncharacterized repeat protein (TIGR01451 family)
MKSNGTSTFGNNTFNSVALKRGSTGSTFIARVLIVLLFCTCLSPASDSIVPNRVLASDGDPVSSFGTDGVVMTDFAGGHDSANAVAVDFLGRFFVAGFATVPGQGTDFALARYDETGTLDPTFGTNGKVTTDFFGANDGARSMVVQPNGNLVVSGFTTNGSERQFALAGYLGNGTLNPAFGQGGKQTFDLGTTSEAVKMAAQADGKLLVVGESRPQNSLDFTVLRLNADGTLDSTFGDNGLVRVDFGNADRATCIAIDDSNIFVGGVAVKSATDSDFAILRLNPNGSLNTLFDGDGKLTVDFFGKQDGAQTLIIGNSLAPMNDRHLMIGGSATNDTADFAVASVNFDGTLDTSRFNQGKDTVDFSGGRDIVLDLDSQPDGDFVATGWAGTGANFDLGIAKWNSRGSRDSRWGLQGEYTYDTAAGGNNVAFGAAIHKDTIVTVGQGLNPATGNDDFIVTQHQNEKFFEFKKSALTSAVERGDIITYTFEITNLTDGLYGFFIDDILPLGVTFIANGNDGWLQSSLGPNVFTRFVQVPAGATIFISLRVRAEVTGTIVNVARLFQRVSGGLEDAVYATDDVELEVTEPERPQITNVSRFGKDLSVTLSKPIDPDQSDALLQNAIKPQASCPVVLFDGVKQKTKPDADNPSTVLTVKKGYKKIARGQSVRIRVRLCNGDETDDFIFTRTQ